MPAESRPFVLGVPRGVERGTPLRSGDLNLFQQANEPQEPMEEESSTTLSPSASSGSVPPQHLTLGVPRGVERGTPLRLEDVNLFQQETEPSEPIEEGAENSVFSFPFVLSAMAIMAIVVGLGLLFLLSQTISLWRTLSELPAPAQWIGIFAAGALTLAVLFSIIYLGRAYFKLAVSPRVSQGALRELDEREKTRAETQQKTVLAVRRIEEFLKAYTIDKKQLERLGGNSDEIQQIAKVRERLLKGRRPLGGGDNWLRDVDKKFLQLLDTIADRRIKLTAKKVALATAVAPTGFIDSGIVAVNSYQLIGDLCRIYNLRADRWSTIRILGQVLLNLFVAGNMEDATEEVGNMFTNAVTNFAGFGSSALARWVGARATEGAANGLLTWRLGRTAQRRLRPITA